MDEPSRAIRCLQRYPRGRLVGAGTYAEVFESADLQASRPVALKRNRLGHCRDDKGVALSGLLDLRATQEAWARACERCSADGAGLSFVSRPVEAFIDKGRLHVVLDRARADLHTVLSAIQHRLLDPGGLLEAAGVPPPPPLSPTTIAGIMRCVLSGLADLHACGLAHQDVKPGNVLLLPLPPPAGGGPSPLHPRPAPVVLCDLGMSDRVPGGREIGAAVEASAAAEVARRLSSADGGAGAGLGGAAAAAPEAAAAAAGSPAPSGGGGVGDDGDDGSESDDWDGSGTAASRSVSRWAGGAFHQVVTVAYRAPELLFGSRAHGPEVDGWSAGVLLLELLRLSSSARGGGAAAAPAVC